MSSACVCHIHGEYCFYCEMYLPLEDENKHLQADNKRLSAFIESESELAIDVIRENEQLRAENARYHSALELMDTRIHPFYPRSQLVKWAIAALDGEEVIVNATQ